MKGALQGLAKLLWEWVETDPVRISANTVTGQMSRLLHAAITAEIEHRPTYDPELDHRVLWAREVIRTARTGRPKAPADLRAVVGMLINEKVEGDES